MHTNVSCLRSSTKVLSQRVHDPKGSPSPLDFGAGAALPNPTC